MIEQIRMAALPDGTVEVTVQRRGRWVPGPRRWHPNQETVAFATWGQALAFIAQTIAARGGPEPTPPPSGTTEIDAEAMAA